MRRELTHPVTLLKFLHALCEERPKLSIYVLAWDFSFAYLSEREWLQGLKFEYSSNPRVRFEWDTHPVAGASHHQKFVVVDGAVGFLGGIDICDARWDDCDHRRHNPQRVNLAGEPCKPYHDVQAAITGEAARPLVDVFVERWQRATGERLELAPASAETRARFDLTQLSEGRAEPICVKSAAFSRTQQDTRADPAEIDELRQLLGDALRAAERLIYAETQYFTSRSIAAVLIERMRDERLPKLEIVVCMPHGADSPKEKLALGDTQEAMLHALVETARQTGHELRLLYSATRNEDGSETPTFIHAKLLIVDDQLLMVGSPNLTERSIGLDTEIAVTWQCNGEDQESRDCIRNIRTRLLAEHSGLAAKRARLPARIVRENRSVDRPREQSPQAASRSKRRPARPVHGRDFRPSGRTACRCTIEWQRSSRWPLRSRALVRQRNSRPRHPLAWPPLGLTSDFSFDCGVARTHPESSLRATVSLALGAWASARCSCRPSCRHLSILFYRRHTGAGRRGRSWRPRERRRP